MPTVGRGGVLFRERMEEVKEYKYLGTAIQSWR